jgi:hypothetical protein
VYPAVGGHSDRRKFPTDPAALNQYCHDNWRGDVVEKAATLSVEALLSTADVSRAMLLVEQTIERWTLDGHYCHYWKGVHVILFRTAFHSETRPALPPGPVGRTSHPVAPWVAAASKPLVEGGLGMCKTALHSHIAYAVLLTKYPALSQVGMSPREIMGNMKILKEMLLVTRHHWSWENKECPAARAMFYGLVCDHNTL